MSSRRRGLPRSPTLRILWIFALSRFWTAAWVYVAHAARPYRSPVVGGWRGVDDWLLNPWTTYDSQWFLAIAERGYDLPTAPFFPLYPWLLRVAGPDPISMAAWGIAISNACFAAALLLLHRLARLDGSDATAMRAVWLLAFFPTAAFFSAVYTESLFLLLLVGTFYLARRRRWVGAGLAGLLASLTRNPGVVIFAALALEYGLQTRRERREVGWLPLLSISLPLLGFLAFQLHLALQLGEPFSVVTAQSDYHRQPTWPWIPILKDLWILVRDPSLSLVVNLTAAILPFVWAVRYRRELPPSYTVLMLSIMLMHLCYSRLGVPHTNSAARYASTTFPFTLLMARGAEGIPAGRPRRYAFILYLSVNASYCLGFGSKAFLG